MSRNFYVRMQVNFTRINKIETMYERSRVDVKVEPRLSYICAYTTEIFFFVSPI